MLYKDLSGHHLNPLGDIHHNYNFNHQPQFPVEPHLHSLLSPDDERFKPDADYEYPSNDGKEMRDQALDHEPLSSIQPVPSAQERIGSKSSHKSDKHNNHNNHSDPREYRPFHSNSFYHLSYLLPSPCPGTGTAVRL